MNNELPSLPDYNKLEVDIKKDTSRIDKINDRMDIVYYEKD